MIPWHGFAVALGIGLLIGLERERSPGVKFQVLSYAEALTPQLLQPAPIDEVPPQDR